MTDELPEEFPCKLTNWDYVYDLCRAVSDEVRADGYEPEVVVALARGGWFAGRCVCDFLGLDDLVSLKVEHYVGAAERSGEATVRYQLPEGSVAGKDVLVVDDIADTGASLRRAREYVTDHDPGCVRTATLQLNPGSDVEPDFLGERLEEWAWIVYPWNFLEDMEDLLTGVMDKEGGGVFDEDDLRHLLATYHEVERIEMEIAQPGRLPEVLSELERRGHVERVDGGWRRLD
jgi:hypoxanthine phosphoribosyltransferase